MRSFKEVWAEKEKEGYQYGRDALEGVHFGYMLALEEMKRSLVVVLEKTRNDDYDS